MAVLMLDCASRINYRFKTKYIMSTEQNSSAPSSPYLELARVPLPTRIRLGERDLEVSQLSDQQRAVLVDLSRIDKEIADAEFSLRVLKAAKAELSKLLTGLSSPPNGEIKTLFNS